MNTLIDLCTVPTGVVQSGRIRSLVPDATPTPLRTQDGRSWFWVAIPSHPNGGFYLPSLEVDHDDDHSDPGNAEQAGQP